MSNFIQHSVKVLKISTWIGAISALLIVLLVGFFVIFPAFLKAPIQQQLSSFSGLDVALSKITFDFNRGNINLHVHDIDVVSAKDKQSVVSIDNLYWQLDWFSVFKDIYNPSEIDIDTLSIYSSISDMSMANIHSFINPETLSMLRLFKTVRVNKTIITGDYNFELAPQVLSINKEKLQLNIAQQMLGSKTFDISASFLLPQAEKQAIFTVPIIIDGADFKLISTLKAYTEQTQDFIEFVATAQHMNMVDVPDYLPVELVGKLTNEWMRQAFKSGELDNINIRIKQDMLNLNLTEVNFNAHLSNATLLFDPEWPTLKQLDANITTDGKLLDIKANSAILSQLFLQNIDVKIPDMTKDILEVKVLGKVSTQSEEIIGFLKDTPLNSIVEPILAQFTLSGEAVGDINLVIPLGDIQPIIDVDLQVTDNYLAVLDGAVKVGNFDSYVGFHNNIITTKGTGSIRGRTFDIRVNPSDKTTNQNALFAVELENKTDQFNAYISQQSEQLWQAKVSSEVVQTDIEIAFNDNDFPIVTLIDLRVATPDKIKGNWKILPADLPSMNLRSRGMQVDGYKLPNFKVDLHSNPKVLNINNLEFDGIGVNQHNLSFNGNWLNGITTLVAKAKGDKLSDFLAKMNVKEKVAGGVFELDIRLFCQCEPWNINLQDISGYASMDVKEGVFSEQDNNIGRVLSLLNIQSIARRLKLQVNDITSDGFVYDNIKASVYLGDALVKIENFELNATSSNIQLSGNSNIVDKQYNLIASVYPAVGDSIPIATFLAGGGLAGLGVWAVDKLLFDGKVVSAVVDNVAEFEYKITGPWDNPIIK